MRLDVFNQWGGTFAWEATDAQLSDHQREILASLRTVTPEGSCPLGTGSPLYRFTVVHADGSTTKLGAAQGNVACNRKLPAVNVRGIEQLVATLDCVPTGASLGDLSQTRTVRPDTGCKHGLFAGQPPHWLKLTIEQPGRLYASRLSNCAGKDTTIEVFDATGATLLASHSAAGSDSAGCAGVTTRFDTAGTYAVKLKIGGGSSSEHVYFEVFESIQRLLERPAVPRGAQPPVVIFERPFDR